MTGITQTVSRVATPPARARRSMLARLGPLLYRVGGLAALVSAWSVLSFWIGPEIVPQPLTVALRMGNVVVEEEFVRNMTATLVRVVAGLLLSLLVATVLGVCMGLSRSTERFFDVLVLSFRTMPGLAWALLAVMIIGISGRAPILAVVLAVAPLLTLQIWEGTKALDRDLFRMASVFRVGRRRQFSQVVMPAILPSIAGAAKLGLALSWKVTVLAELFGVDSGVGNEISANFQIFSLDGVLAWALLFALVMALIEYMVIAPLYSWLTRWRRGSDQLPILTRILRQATWSRRVADTRMGGIA